MSPSASMQLAIVAWSCFLSCSCCGRDFACSLCGSLIVVGAFASAETASAKVIAKEMGLIDNVVLFFTLYCAETSPTLKIDCR